MNGGAEEGKPPLTKTLLLKKNACTRSNNGARFSRGVARMVISTGSLVAALYLYLLCTASKFKT